MFFVGGCDATVRSYCTDYMRILCNL